MTVGKELVRELSKLGACYQPTELTSVPRPPHGRRTDNHNSYVFCDLHVCSVSSTKIETRLEVSP